MNTKNQILATIVTSDGLIPRLFIVTILAVSGSDCQHPWKRGPVPGVNENLLFRASSKGDVDEVKRLLDRGTNVDAREENGETPLMYAAVEDRTEIVEILLDRGSDINAASLNGETALTKAVIVSRYNAVSRLLTRGADIEKDNPLMYAAGGGDVKMIKLLLEAGANINAQNREGDTALTAAVSRRASPETVQILLSAGADVNIRNKRSETPLTLAERNGDEAVVNLLSTAR